MKEDKEEHKGEQREVTESRRLTDPGINPFPGLRPFKINESHLFFGREGQSDEVLLKLSKNRFVGVIGPSGSGKSSFVYCGVLPILYGGFLTDVSADWEVVVTRPGAGPIENLAESLLRSDQAYRDSDPEEKKVKRTIFSTLLRSSSLGLVEAVKQFKKANKKNYLILVDQFEELFRFKESREAGAVDETLAFINLLLEAVDNPETPIYVGITMRSDFIGECAQFAELTKKINDSHYLIPQMTREQKRRAIEGPVAVGGAEVSSRLVQRLLNDLGDNPDQLPILQHSLMRTWDYWRRFRDVDDEDVDIKHYEAIGTMSEALSLHANEAYDELDDEQKRICESLFKAITERRGENFGIRRPTRLGDIAAIAHAKPKEVAAVIDKFREPGRSLLIPAAGITLTPKSVIDISHESLMRIWVRLKNWVEDESEAVNMYIRLAEAASMYQLGKSGLWRPPDLQLALNWESKHQPTLIWAQRYHPAFERTMEFLSHSKREFETEQRIKELQAKRRLKTARITAMVMAGLTVVAIGFLIYAFDQNAEAKEQTRIAALERDTAQINEIAALNAKDRADSLAGVALDREIEAQESAQAALRSADQADSSARVAELRRIEANLAAARAQRAEGMALDSAAAAQRARLLALQNKDLAETEAERAKRGQYQAVAKQIALKSQEFEGEDFRDIKGLLAQQAYIFNKEWGGYEYNGDVYKGLYFALKEFDNDITDTHFDVYKSPGDIHLLGSATLEEVYSIHESGEIHKWTNFSEEKILDAIPFSTTKAAALSPNSHLLAIGGTNSTGAFLKIVHLLNPSDIDDVKGLGDGVIDIKFHGNDALYILDDHGEHIKEYRNGQVRTIFDPGSKTHSKLTEIDVSANNRYLYGVSEDGILHRWDLQNNYEERILFRPDPSRTGLKVRIEALTVSDDGKVAIGDASGRLHMITGTNVKTLVGHTAAIGSIAFSYDGKFLATASNDQTVRLWNLLDIDKDPIELDDHNGAVTDMIFAKDNNTVIAGTHVKAIKIWPTRPDQMSDLLCPNLSRPMTDEEWLRFIGDPDEIPFEDTCEKSQDLNSGGQ